MALGSQRLRSSEDSKHVLLSEQRAAAGRAVTDEPAGRQPSIDCPYLDAAKSSDLAFRQKLLVVGHDFFLRTAPLQAPFRAGDAFQRATTLNGKAYVSPHGPRHAIRSTMGDDLRAIVSADALATALRFSLKRASISDRCPGESIVLQTQSTGHGSLEGSGPDYATRICAAIVKAIAEVKAMVDAENLGPELYDAVQHAREVHDLLREQVAATLQKSLFACAVSALQWGITSAG